MHSPKIQEGSGKPIVIKQKEDVVYISDPNPEWRYWGPLKVGDVPSITISIQNNQAIALLLKKYNALGTEKFSTVSSNKVKARFGAVNNSFGE